MLQLVHVRNTKKIIASKKYYICKMRIGLLTLLIILLSSGLTTYASEFTIPKKFRGRYVCEVPSYFINHLETSTQVDALKAILLVYKTKVIIRIGDRSFPANVKRMESPKKQPIYTAGFPPPFNNCTLTFDKSKKTVSIDAKIFQQTPFQKVRL